MAQSYAGNPLESADIAADVHITHGAQDLVYLVWENTFPKLTRAGVGARNGFGKPRGMFFQAVCKTSSISELSSKDYSTER